MDTFDLSNQPGWSTRVSKCEGQMGDKPQEQDRKIVKRGEGQ